MPIATKNNTISQNPADQFYRPAGFSFVLEMERKGTFLIQKHILAMGGLWPCHYNHERMFAYEYLPAKRRLL